MRCLVFTVAEIQLGELGLNGQPLLIGQLVILCVIGSPDVMTYDIRNTLVDSVVVDTGDQFFTS